ncbi:MAG: chromate efflux transporter [Saccharospirillaceae bacterium]|nr:chromate efflux transporter [Saccharospirillaceae bacterium]
MVRPIIQYALDFGRVRLITRLRVTGFTLSQGFQVHFRSTANVTTETETMSASPEISTECATPMAVRLWDVFRQFLWLGCISFGGPAAHLGYFQRTFVQRLQWLSDGHYAQLVALAQFLPGPASSQVGFGIGVLRGGIAGGMTAFIAFTLPSFLLMLALASSLDLLLQYHWFPAAIHGLKLLAVIVVADATLSMAKTFCSTAFSRILMLLTAVALWLTPLPVWLLLILAAFCGWIYSRWQGKAPADSAMPAERQAQQAGPYQAGRLALLIGLMFWGGLYVFSGLNGSSPDGSAQALNVFAAFYQTGSLVFGGGHVVLPLVQQQFADQLSTEILLTGYGAAQLVPGPMFTFATFAGAELLPEAPFTGALLATLGVFLPGFILLLAFTPLWSHWLVKPGLNRALMGINAAVVGLLLATLVTPVASSSLLNGADIVFAVVGFIALRRKALNVIGLIPLALGFGLLAP